MVKVFRPPTTLIASDLGREFEGALAIRTETDGTYLDPSGLEPPYQRGITERAGKTFKLMLSKTMETYDCQDEEERRELVDVVNYQKNRLLMEKRLLTTSTSHRLRPQITWRATFRRCLKPSAT